MRQCFEFFEGNAAFTHSFPFHTLAMNRKSFGIKERGNTMNCACNLFSKDVLLWVILIAVVILLFCFC